ncbi:MAG: hypothetical protein CSA66_04570, partial [Proteobacteria bacterium]
GPSEVSRTPDGQAVIHRRLPGRDGASGQGRAPIFVYDPVRGGGLPQEMHRDGQTLPRPQAEPPTEGEAVYAPGGVAPAAPRGFGGDGEAGPDGASALEPAEGPGPFGAEPGPGAEGPPVPDPRLGLGDVARPDLATEREGTLDYQTVFDPSVVPFKRNRALDTVTAGYTLTVSRGRVEVLAPTGNTLAVGREAFWGSLWVDGEAGRRVPLPSVSPDSHILSYEAVPDVALTFERDRAGNYYVTPEASGRLRLVFVMDAPTGYFGRPIPARLRVSDVPRELRPRVPPAIRREGEAVARTLGLRRSDPYGAILRGLVRWSRGFEPGEPPAASVGSVYRDLALAQRGVCRHRGYAFVITAQSLGIPARYVFNEAHVFVEVYVPGRDAGWLRVDLGGGAERLVVHGGQDKTLHRPRRRDPFERPRAYARQVAAGETAGASRVEGLPPRARRGAGEAGPPREATAPLPEAVRAMLNRSVPRAVPVAGKIATRTTMALGEAIVFRGDAVAVCGAVRDERGRPVAGGDVRLLLLRGEDRRAVALLQTALLDAEGRFCTVVRIPEQQPPGDYEIVAEFGGSTRYGPSVSE